MQAMFANSPIFVLFYSILARFTLKLFYIFLPLSQIGHYSLIRFCLTIE